MAIVDVDGDTADVVLDDDDVVFVATLFKASRTEKSNPVSAASCTSTGRCWWLRRRRRLGNHNQTEEYSNYTFSSN